MDHSDRSKGFNLFLRTSVGQMSTKLYNSHFRKYCIAEASVGHGANHSKKRVHVFRFESCDGSCGMKESPSNAKLRIRPPSFPTSTSFIERIVPLGSCTLRY